VEDKQVRSIEDQIAKLHTFAKQEDITIIEVFIEKQSAKIPGRPIFGEMLARSENGEANGILAWHADRLARNAVDDGRIIYLLDCGRIQSLKFPTLWFENTPQGKFMLNIVFGQSKYYIDSLAENTKRGLRQKVKRGEYPSLAPIGYINDKRIKSVVVDKKHAPIIRKAFELYAQDNSRLEDISNFLAQNGILSRGGKRIK
jgi:DNA invertase Pin-like site-specific DNA recombinase